MKLPKLTELKEKFETLSLKERRIFCDSVFFAINWFREVKKKIYLIESRCFDFQ